MTTWDIAPQACILDRVRAPQSSPAETAAVVGARLNEYPIRANIN